MDSVSLLDTDTRIRVSSTLDKSVGKKFLVDGSPETCWTSQQGLPQYIHLTFTSPVIPKVISMTFQGGFVGTRCAIDVLPASPSAEDASEDVTTAPLKAKMQHQTHIYPEDVNRRQSFELPASSAAVNQIKIVFEESSDFFGRITIYDLQILGLHV